MFLAQVCVARRTCRATIALVQSKAFIGLYWFARVFIGQELC